MEVSLSIIFSVVSVTLLLRGKKIFLKASDSQMCIVFWMTVY